MITAAALKLADGTIISRIAPARHPTLILDAQVKGKSLSGAIKGFLTDEGVFKTREEAYRIAFPSRPPRKLYTEDLW